MGQISMEIIRLPGSLLSGNQQRFPASVSLRGFSEGLAFRQAVSVRGI